MKNLIIYFSSTGNSFFAAKYLTEHMDDCVAIPVTKIDTNMDIGSYASVGFIFPAYFLGIPRFFSRGIRLDFSKDTYFYGITTCNGFPGSTGYQLQMLLEGMGCELSFFRVLSMPGNNIFAYGPPAEGAINRKIIAAEKKLADIVPMIDRRYTEAVKKKQSLISSLFYSVMYKSQYKWHRKFHVNSKCLSCGLCDKICRFDNVTADSGKPR